LIQNSLKNGEITVCAFLNISRVFDNTTQRCPTEKGCRQSNYELDELGAAETTVCSSTIEVGKACGTPQGAVYSPLLWSLKEDEFLNKLTSTGPQCLGYADDIFIAVKRKYEHTLCEMIHEMIMHGHGADYKSSQNRCCTMHKKKEANLKTIGISGEVLELKQLNF